MIKLDKSEYPARMFMNANDCIEIKGGVNKWGSALKLKLREVAKRNQLYHKKIVCDVAGQDENGREIPINTVGRWVFGVPGYMGHIRCLQEEQITIQVPKDCPADALELINWAVGNLKN